MKAKKLVQLVGLLTEAVRTVSFVDIQQRLYVNDPEMSAAYAADMEAARNRIRRILDDLSEEVER